MRPTPDRVRETLFNWLGQTLYGRRCLDLFAGSGALGFEAASRGAEQVVMVEQDRTVHRALQQACGKLAFPNVALHCDDGLKFASQTKSKFDVVFLDPPFRSDLLQRVMPQLPHLLTADGMVYVESGAEFDAGADWQVLKQRQAGAVHYQLLQRIQA